MNVRDMPVSQLALSRRAENVIKDACISTIGEIEKSWESLAYRRNCGRKSLREIQEVLSELGIQLPDPHIVCKPAHYEGPRAILVMFDKDLEVFLKNARREWKNKNNAIDIRRKMSAAKAAFKQRQKADRDRRTDERLFYVLRQVMKGRSYASIGRDIGVSPTMIRSNFQKATRMYNPVSKKERFATLPNDIKSFMASIYGT